ncbi:hypothetical protein [Escherichia coli]|uniref:hypothetical protein n=1 Tax=Escherichia coli TaxID=562 RepID=UPI0030EB42E9
MAHKTKATAEGRQWHNTKLEHIQNTRLCWLVGNAISLARFAAMPAMSVFS